MAHIFKHPNINSKGIIVFTHKEYVLFNESFKLRKADIKRLDVFFKNFYIRYRLKEEFDKNLDALKKNYFIGIHWGYAFKDVLSSEWVDFHMSAKGTATFNENPFIIPLNSANFTPEVMKKKDTIKYWDIICVAKNDFKKNYSKLLNSVRKIYDLGYKYKILFVIASNLIEKSDNFYVDILDHYFEMFSAEEREIFTIIKTHPETGFQGFSYTFLSHLYNQSKVFTIFSQKEGECRVIKEAQLCGLPIVVKSDLEGGGRDYLNEENSVYFDNYDSAHTSLIYAVENYENFTFDTHELRKLLSESDSIKTLHKYFEELFTLNNLEYDNQLINLNNLNRRLPAHYFDQSITWANSEKFRFTTTDIVDISMLKKFYDELILE